MKLASRLFLLLVLAGAAGSGWSVSAQTRKPARKRPPAALVYHAAGPPPAKPTPESQRRIDAFLKVWNTLNQNYYDPTFSNLDWTKIKVEFEPRVRAATSDKELYSILNEMLGRLHRSHLAIIPPDVYQAIERAKIEAKAREIQRESRDDDADESDAAAPAEDEDPLTPYGIGVDLRLLDNRLVVTRLDKNSSAERAGIKPGYIIEKINGVSLTDLLRRIDLNSSTSAKIRKFLPYVIVSSFLRGEKGSEVAVSYLDASNAAKEVALPRERLRSQTVSLGSNFPDRQLQFESSSLNDDVGYIRFDLFALPVIDDFCRAVGSMKGKKALIIDLRGNMGGVLATMVGLGGMLTDRSIDLGTSIYKTGEERLSAASKANHFSGKVVFLVDGQTVSAAEIFAASLQDAKRAIVIGDKTAGEALPSVALDLPTGAVMLYPIANYRSPSGKYLEGNGVQPDIVVPLNRASLLDGRDDQLQAALKIIEDDKAFPAPAPTSETTASSVIQRLATGRQTGPPPAPVKRSKAPPPQLELVAKLPPAQPPPAAKPPTNIRDAASLRIIGDFVAAIGGADALRQIKSYTLTGTTELVVKGSRNQFDLDIYFDKPGKYTEMMHSDSAGEIRVVHNGKTHFVQTDYGYVRDLPQFQDTGDIDILAPIRTIADPELYASLTFVGEFDRDGRKVNVIDARTKEGYYLSMAFDAVNKTLVSFTGSYYALNFSDYRKTGPVSLPFKIERERIMNISLDAISVNTPIAEDKFERKVNCFDRAD